MEYLTENNVAVGLRMRQIRRASRMTQEKLADTLGVSVNYLGEVERGRKPLSRSLADQFCQYFHVTYDYLYHGYQIAPNNQIRERSLYQSTHQALLDPLLEQLEDCSADEILVISHLIGTYLDISRLLAKKHTQQNHRRRQKHSDPEYRPADFS